MEILFGRKWQGRTFSFFVIAKWSWSQFQMSTFVLSQQLETVVDLLADLTLSICPVFHCLLKAATRSYDPSYFSSLKSRNICFRVLLCFHDLIASALNQAESLGTKSSSSVNALLDKTAHSRRIECNGEPCGGKCLACGRFPGLRCGL